MSEYHHLSPGGPCGQTCARKSPSGFQEGIGFSNILFLSRYFLRDQTRILDVGVEDALHSWSNFIEEHYYYLQNITASAIEEGKNFNQRYPLVKTVIY
jgi:hypothetical protein